jgi:hypothetical protein
MNFLTNVFALVLAGLSKTVQAGQVTFMVTVREIETSDTHSCFNQDLKLRHLPACRPKGADDLGASFRDIGGCCNLVQGYVGSTKFRPVGIAISLALHFDLICYVEK